MYASPGLLNANFNEAYLIIFVLGLLCCPCLFLSSVLSFLPFMLCVLEFFNGWQIVISPGCYTQLTPFFTNILKYNLLPYSC